MERVKGIEPSYSAWKAAALPLSYTRLMEVLMPALAASGKMECCVSGGRLDPKDVDGRKKSGHDSVGAKWVVGLGECVSGTGTGRSNGYEVRVRACIRAGYERPACFRTGYKIRF